MTTQVLVPVMGEAIGEARLTTWLKQPGEPVRRGDELAELETDKAMLMLECPADGVLLEIYVEAGVMVISGQLLAQVGRPGETTTPASSDVASPANPSPARVAPVAEDAHFRQRISPAAQRLARQLGLDVAALVPGRPGARITTEDVNRAFAARGGQPQSSTRLPQRRVLLTGTQRAMAARMAQSAREIPQFAVSIEVDATRLLQVKAELAHTAKAASVTALLVYLAARVLLRHPLLNARFDGDAAIVFATANMGVAVASPQGLVVPVLHRAEQLGLAEVARQLAHLAEAAREGRLTLAQVSEGTFTLSNLGMYGVTQFVPLVNPPQAAILGVAAAQPAVLPTATGTRHIQRMHLTVSADHRLVDGAAAASFLQELRHALEAPDID